MPIFKYSLHVDHGKGMNLVSRHETPGQMAAAITELKSRVSTTCSIVVIRQNPERKRSSNGRFAKPYELMRRAGAKELRRNDRKHLPVGASTIADLSAIMPEKKSTPMDMGLLKYRMLDQQYPLQFYPIAPSELRKFKMGLAKVHAKLRTQLMAGVAQVSHLF